MLAALLDRQITIQSKVTTKDNIGQVVETYTTVNTTHASVKYLRGEQKYNDGQRIFETVQFTIRNTTINYDHRILYEGQKYEIKEIQELGRKEGYQIRCIFTHGK